MRSGGRTRVTSLLPHQRPHFAPAGLAVAGVGIAWHTPTLAGWVVTGALGLTGAALEGWRIWLSYQYALTELAFADQASKRIDELEQVRLTLDDRRSEREHDLATARLEEAQELWSTPGAERSASLSIDLRDTPPEGSAMPRRPRGKDRYRS